MPGESFRFIHASDFHLEMPLGDLDVLPPHLREAMADAPRKAAQAVFEAALADNIDYLLLSGDLLSPTAAGPHGMALLLDYFDQLEAKDKPVFWAAGIADDPKKWPESVPLPTNVTLFPKNRTVEVPVQRGGHTICMVVGRSSDGRSVLHVPSYRIEATDEFTVAVGYGESNVEALAEGRFDYWALGGRHVREVMDGGASGGAIYCGSPQGKSLMEAGAHGYTVVDVDGDQTVRIQSIECDSFRYCSVKADGAEIAAVGGIRNFMGERIMHLQHESGGRHLLIGWEISLASGDDLHALGDVEALIQWVRREYGHGAPSAWTTRVGVRPPRSFPKAWNDEDTILGDFLRASEKHRKQESQDLNLYPMTEEHGEVTGTTSTLLAETTSSNRMNLLDQATLLGVELLRGGKPNWVQKS